MCLDINCIRDIIIYCVENIDYKEIPVNSWKVISVSLDKLYNSEKLSKYEKKDIKPYLSARSPVSAYDIPCSESGHVQQV